MRGRMVTGTEWEAGLTMAHVLCTKFIPVGQVGSTVHVLFVNFNK